jgi:cytochrome c553
MGNSFRRGALLAPVFGVLFAASAFAQTSTAPVAVPESFPAWAYPWVPDFKVPPDDGVPRHVPDSAAAFTITQERDLFFSPDWHPEDHGPMPDIVAKGRPPDARACGSCHRSEGTGGPENASLAGLPAAYIVQQVADYKNGARKFSGPQRSPVLLMTAAAKAVTDAEIQAVAAYYSALKPKRIIKVVESDTAPKSQIARVFYMKLPEGGVEPLGRRILEVPDDVAQFEHRDTRAQFTAYVPPGSIAKGEAIAKSGAAASCMTCHGPDLKGVGLIPRIAGRSPSYIARQIYDIQQGARAGEASAIMKPAVEKLSSDDIIALAAYVGSLEP